MINADVQVSSTDSLLRITAIKEEAGENQSSQALALSSEQKENIEQMLKEATEEYKKEYEAKAEQLKNQFISKSVYHFQLIVLIMEWSVQSTRSLCTRET